MTKLFPPLVTHPQHSKRLRWFLWTMIILGLVATSLLTFLLDTKISTHHESERTTQHNEDIALTPFPISVDPETKTITEDPAVDAFMNNFVASNHTAPNISDSWFGRAISRLATLDWYQNLATPVTRILVIQSGERYEEITRNFARILRWDKAEQEIFVERLLSEVPEFKNGKLYPGRYVVPSDAGPEEVAINIAERFNAEVRTRYTDDIAQTISLEDTLIIAALIEREAYDFEDMRYISGVIWNRLFVGMRLQIDATLQYAKASQTAGAGGVWWPVPKSEDKYIKSPFNTYQNAGLPPEPISNPSIDAIIAALNPRNTSCLFYYHTNDGTFYCNETYEAHVAGIKRDLK